MDVFEVDCGLSSTGWNLSYAAGYLDLGMYAKASRELDTVPDEFQDDPEVLCLRGRILLAEERWSEAVTLCRSSKKKYPEVADFFIQLALAYDKLGQVEKARITWLDAPEEIRTSAFYHYNLARCESQMGNWALARQHVMTAQALSPEIRPVLARDAWLLPFVQQPEMN